LSQNELAVSLETSQAAVSNYLNNSRVPSFETVILLSKKYQINLNWLAGIEKNMFIKGAKFDMFQAKKILENRIKFYKKEKTYKLIKV